MKKVLLVNAHIYAPGEGGYKRTLYLFDMMRKMGYDVTLLTSDFNHYAKKQRNIELFRKDYPEYGNIEFLHMEPYQKNISLKRWWCLRNFTKLELSWIYEHIREYDLVYMNMPGADTINSVESYINKNKLNIPIIVDVRDLLPEALRVKFKNETIYKILTCVLKRNADRAYAAADNLIAVSQQYLDRGMKTNRKSKNPTVVYIGSILELFDEGIEKYAPTITKPEGEFWLTYAGTIGSSYDLKTAIDAMEIIREKAPNVRLKILGQGPDRPALEAQAKEMSLPVDFVGFVSYPEMAAYLSKSDIALNSIKARGSQSIINKVADYYAAGIPMLNSCMCEEQLWLNDHYQAGLNIKPENVDDFVEKFMTLYNNPELCKKMGENARKLAFERFDRKNSYKKIIELIELTQRFNVRL